MPRREICHILSISQRTVVPLTLKLILGLSFFLDETRCNIHFRRGSFVDRDIIDDLPRFHNRNNPAERMIHPH